MKKILLILFMFILSFDVMADTITSDEYLSVSTKLSESYTKFIGACSPEERLAIIKYANGNLEMMSGGYETVVGLTTDNGKNINDFCANYSEDLYDALKNVEKYIGMSDMYSLNLESDYTVKKNVFVTGNKILSRKDLTIVDDCDLIEDKFVDVLNEYFGYFQIGCASLTILLCMVDIYKAFVSKDVDGKKAFNNIKKRIIALVIFLLIPIIINIIIDLINRYVSVSALKCLES